jgi:alkaline phosphatase
MSKLKKKTHASKNLLVATLLFMSICPFLCSNTNNQSQSLQTNTDKFPLLTEAKVKNIILFIGDGMSFAQVIATRIKNKGISGRLNMERMPVVGFTDTFSANELITDSSAAATALATGFKTNNGMIAVTPAGKKALTILEACRDIGKATGIVVTCSLTQPTPAGFATHIQNRWEEPKIAEAIIDNRVNVLLGGGRSFFIPKSQPKSRRQDDINLVNTAIAKGYKYVETKEQLNSVSGHNVLGLFNENNLAKEASEPSLAEMTAISIRLLDQNPEGFFLMVEGSLIDSACHRYDIEQLVNEMKDFDEAILEAIKFALTDKKTLVLVNGDHETGGLVIDEGSLDGKKLSTKWSSRFHSVVPTPLFTFGPSANYFSGYFDNTDIPKIMARLLGIKDFPALY